MNKAATNNEICEKYVEMARSCTQNERCIINRNQMPIKWKEKEARKTDNAIGGLH